MMNRRSFLGVVGVTFAGGGASMSTNGSSVERETEVVSSILEEANFVEDATITNRPLAPSQYIQFNTGLVGFSIFDELQNHRSLEMVSVANWGSRDREDGNVVVEVAHRAEQKLPHESANRIGEADYSVTPVWDELIALVESDDVDSSGIFELAKIENPNLVTVVFDDDEGSVFVRAIREHERLFISGSFVTDFGKLAVVVRPVYHSTSKPKSGTASSSS